MLTVRLTCIAKVLVLLLSTFEAKRTIGVIIALFG